MASVHKWRVPHTENSFGHNMDTLLIIIRRWNINNIRWATARATKRPPVQCNVAYTFCFRVCVCVWCLSLMYAYKHSIEVWRVSTGYTRLECIMSNRLYCHFSACTNSKLHRTEYSNTRSYYYYVLDTYATLLYYHIIILK